MVRQSDWVNRSIYYLCRMHGKLERGDKYRDAVPTLHIGIIDFDLEYEDGQKRDAFYSECLMMDVKTSEIYSSQIGINVLNLKYLEHATEEQRANGLYDWARMFNATTWEELKNMADISDDFTTVAEEVYNHSVDEKTRIMLIKRDMYIRDQLSREAHEREAQEILQRKAELEQQNAELEQHSAELEERSAELKQQNAELEEQNAELEEQNAELEERSVELEQQNTELEKRVKGQKQEINNLQEEIAALKEQLAAMK